MTETLSADALHQLFTEIADRERSMASAFRFAGRYTLAQQHQARAETFAEAAHICLSGVTLVAELDLNQVPAGNAPTDAAD